MSWGKRGHTSRPRPRTAKGRDWLLTARSIPYTRNIAVVQRVLSIFEKPIFCTFTTKPTSSPHRIDSLPVSFSACPPFSPREFGTPFFPIWTPASGRGMHCRLAAAHSFKLLPAVPSPADHAVCRAGAVGAAPRHHPLVSVSLANFSFMTSPQNTPAPRCPFRADVCNNSRMSLARTVATRLPAHRRPRPA